MLLKQSTSTSLSGSAACCLAVSSLWWRSWCSEAFLRLPLCLKMPSDVLLSFAHFIQIIHSEVFYSRRNEVIHFPDTNEKSSLPAWWCPCRYTVHTPRCHLHLWLSTTAAAEGSSWACRQLAECFCCCFFSFFFVGCCC